MAYGAWDRLCLECATLLGSGKGRYGAARSSRNQRGAGFPACRIADILVGRPPTRIGALRHCPGLAGWKARDTADTCLRYRVLSDFLPLGVKYAGWPFGRLWSGMRPSRRTYVLRRRRTNAIKPIAPATRRPTAEGSGTNSTT